MVAIEWLDQDSLWALSRRTDKLGVVSVYVNADPRQDPNLHAAAIDLKNRFRELQCRIVADRGAKGSRDVVAALERLGEQLESLTSPAASGRSRIVFAALDSGWMLRLESAMPVTNRVVLGDTPFIHPLLELLDEGRAAGVVLISAQEARLLEWRAGSLQLLRRIEQPYVQAPHERAGQIGGGPEGQFHTPMREQRQARDRVRMLQFLDRVAEVAADLAGYRGWERILVSGGERWTEPAVARFPRALRGKVFADARIFNGRNEVELATAVTEWVHDQHAEHQRLLLEHVRDVAGSGRTALGLSEVTAALNAGRASHVVYDPQVRYQGTVGADGALYGGDEVGPNGHPVTPEPRLTERLVERALMTGARISPVDGAADGGLKDAEGVAALLRW
ncbi:hypothetical protein ACDT10_09930 [Mycobacterium intracellulare]|uniref:MSMEG_1130 family ribosome hibernation factor n=1 Tax=Mycobacterium intracellulare TaxID=1767 RepID=UPI00355605A0